MCGADKYSNQVEAYQKIVDKVRAEQKVNYSDLKDAETALKKAILDRAVRCAGRNSSSFNTGPNSKAKKKEGRNRSKGSGSNSSSLSTNAENSNATTVVDDESERRSEVSGNSQGSNVSISSGLENQDFIGDVPSSRAHLVPNSDCCFLYGVGCQAVYGANFCDAKSLRKVAERMARSDTNVMRSRAVHGALFDIRPCWIFVPFCSLEFFKNWEDRQGCPVMAIVVGVEGMGQPVTDEKAYSFLCTRPYHDGDENTTGKCFNRLKCERDGSATATDRLREMVLALAGTLVGRQEEISPLDPLWARGDATRLSRGSDPKTELLKKTRDDIETRGVMIPEVQEELDFDDGVEIMKFVIDPSAIDLVPDPMLLLMKATINWTWRCDQKLLPACGSVHSEGEEEEESVVPSTPIPSFIECPPVPMTPDFGDDLSL